MHSVPYVLFCPTTVTYGFCSVGQYSADAAAGETPFPIPPYPYEQPDSPLGSKPPFPLNETFPNLPPGAVVLPPPSKNREDIDEDDLSIYYPPPYSFYYPKQNLTKVSTLKQHAIH